MRACPVLTAARTRFASARYTYAASLFGCLRRSVMVGVLRANGTRARLRRSQRQWLQITLESGHAIGYVHPYSRTIISESDQRGNEAPLISRSHFARSSAL